MAISNQTTEKVRERADIEEVVNDYVSLKRKGQNLWACCPFHQEKTPSFSVSPSKQIYKCFGCGKAGDTIQFIMDIEGVGFNEAIKHLAQKYGIEIEESNAPSTPEEIQQYNEKESLLIVLNYAKNHFAENLKSEEGRSIGLSYFKERGFDAEIIEKFELGYAQNSWDGLLTAGKKAGFETETLMKAGLILEKDGEKWYDRFRGRVIFPFHNLSGKAIAFGARILTNDKKQPKYINSPETEVYHKSDVLYGIYQAKQAIRQHDLCFLVEGYTDVISLHMAGIPNVVASSGTSLTENQIKLIKRFTDNVTVLYDGDPAGIKASLRGIDMLLEGGLFVKAVVFPEGEDPDSYSRKVGKERFASYLKEKSQDFIRFKIGLMWEESREDPIARADGIRQVIHSIGKVGDAMVRNLYVKDASRLLEIDENLIHAEINKHFLSQQRRKDWKEKHMDSPSPQEEFLPVEKPKTDYGNILMLQEKETIRILITYGWEKISEELHVCEYLMQETGELQFETPVYKRMFEYYKQALKKGILPGTDYFLQGNDNEIKQVVIDMVSHKYELSELWEKRFQIFTIKEADDLAKTVYSSVLRLKRRVVHKMLQETMEKMKSAEDADIQELQRVYMEVKSYQVTIDKQLGMVISN
ncbi:DNA primase [Pleomorphovibrio marinus]|uniref:DNA primase n=1 Tax=Pleomorphovibrio marinus TaxID=2164132 RepID=UPI000E0BAB40|nr:DNA primase [Pleomorphovibrio marinus]